MVPKGLTFLHPLLSMERTDLSDKQTEFTGSFSKRSVGFTGCAVAAPLLPTPGPQQEKELQGSMNVSGRAVVTTPISLHLPWG